MTIPTNNMSIENYIYQTKVDLANTLPQIFTAPKNLSNKQYRSLKILRQSRDITIKPADKNLGLVILNTEDYIDQVITHLSSDTYNMVEQFPTTLITKSLENTILKFKNELSGYSKHLYNYLLPSNNHRIPRFYGLPKIHKNFSDTGIPPLRPIVSHSNSLLLHSSQFIDHVLQPIAKSYPDYLHNSTTLVQKLSNIEIPHDAILVCLDIVSLFPSIPQEECLNIINQEMYNHSELLTFDPNLIMQLLLINIRNNYFEFANFTFQQIKGTAMGAAFSPTIANIYMSVFLRKFFSIYKYKPILLARYIDDIFIIWPKTSNFSSFIQHLNSFHSNIKFTNTTSTTTIDFLDLTIYKTNHTNMQKLDIKTFQKPNNLYQYLEFSSNHSTSTYKGIIIGECVRYLRTNTTETNFISQIEIFKARLRNRHYPNKLIEKYTSVITFSKRNEYINKQIQSHPAFRKPLFKSIPLPNYTMLKEVILKHYNSINQHIDSPLFVTLKSKTLRNVLTHAKHNPTDSEIVDILFACRNDRSAPSYTISTSKQTLTPQICRHPRCITCIHYNTNNFFTSTVTKRRYKVRHQFTCSSQNIIYLITCTKCKKQYVGKTTKSLRERINHHRSTILTDQNRYLSIHFNFPDHSLDNLSVQVIDTGIADNLNNLELFWIGTLKTIKPQGLNFRL